MDAREIRKKVASLAEQLATAEKELLAVEKQCQPHDWSETKYTPEHHPGYHIPGDPEGTMGIDRQLPMDVPPRTVPKWTTECRRCGKVETTTKTKEVVSHQPVFPEMGR